MIKDKILLFAGGAGCGAFSAPHGEPLAERSGHYNKTNLEKACDELYNLNILSNML